MNWLRKQLEGSPAAARAVPFLIFLALTFCQGQFGEASRYWFYLLKTLAGVWMIWSVRPLAAELRWAFSWEAVAAGVGVFALWVGLDGHYPSVNELAQKYLQPALKMVGLERWCQPSPAGPDWNPHAQFGQGSALAWLFITVRIAGSSLVVPPIEEMFYRSFLYRYIAKPDFQAVPLGAFLWLSFVATALIFGFSHYQWLAGILCAFIYQGLVCRKKRLGDAMTAHAITNFLLGLWVVFKGAWHFW